MKIVKLIFAVLISFLMGLSTAFAQQEIDDLTPKQLELRNNFKATQKANRNVFLSVLTANQKEIFKDESLSKKERRKTINESLSENQQKELKESRLAMKNAKNKFLESLSETQKTQFKNNKKRKRALGKRHSKFSNIKDLAPNQKKVLMQNKQQIKANRKAFRATFTKSQQIIANDTTLSRKQKREALSKTFSATQTAQLKANKKEMKILHKNFFETLSEDQKLQFKLSVK